MASRLGRTQSALDRVENGHTAVTVEALQDFALSLGCDATLLCGLFELADQELRRRGFEVLRPPPRKPHGATPSPTTAAGRRLLTGRRLAGWMIWWLETKRGVTGVMAPARRDPQWSVHEFRDGPAGVDPALAEGPAMLSPPAAPGDPGHRTRDPADLD